MSDHDIPVQCCRCRNKHMESERVSVPDSKYKNLSISHAVCPKCGARSYFDLRPQIAWCFASGQIEFGDVGAEPKGAIVIASGPKANLKAKVSAMARLSYKGTPLVPGVPESESQDDAADQLSKWLTWCSKGNGKKGHHGVVFYSEENPYVVS
ncbi:MAG: hypothetical protein D3M94_07255 [Rhodocyclales bacterium GT-UBC]|nr:MAG: hypothetical protein D3M94_07255 [Rhodocyclales bacterium GT-UBC]